MVSLPIYSLKDFLWLVDEVDEYPFYAVLLYTPMNGLDQRLHEYVVSHWAFINGLTGTSCLLLAVENVKDARTGIDQFKPADVYAIARHLGADVQDLPCLIFFVRPKHFQETLLLRLREFLSNEGTPSDEDLTDFFRSVSSVVDTCSEGEPATRLECLRNGLDKEWPEGSRWADLASRAGAWLVPSGTTAATVALSMSSLALNIRRLLGWG